MSITEFDLIDKYFKKPNQDCTSVVQGMGDDAALLRPKPNSAIKLTSSTLIEGTHFETGASAEWIGEQSINLLLSKISKSSINDPAWLTLSLTLPAPDEVWLEKFSIGFFRLTAENKLQLVGGDTTRGPIIMVTTQLYSR